MCTGRGSRTRGKRARQEEEDELGDEWETPEGWTGIVSGLHELIVPVYLHCRQRIDVASQLEIESASKKGKRRRDAKGKQRSQGRDASEAEALLNNTLPADLLVALLKNAPTAHVRTPLTVDAVPWSRDYGACG
jgi:hypothetical protein